MRVLLICDAGDGLLDLALRAQAIGHQVKVFVRKYDPQTRPVGRGLVELVADWKQWMQWSDLVVLESNGVYMKEMDLWRQRGCNIVGGNDRSAAWELERTTGMDIFRKAGIPVPEFREFSDYDQAIRYVERRGEPMYSKPCSDTADKSLSAKTGIPEDPTWQLRQWTKKHGRPPFPFLLQEAIDGVEFAVGGWFGPAGFAGEIEENFEHKKFAAGDIGPATGEMGTVMRFVRRSKLADQVLLPLQEQLDLLEYVGNVDVNCIIDATGTPWPLEFTMRLGWPAFAIETSLFKTDPIDFLYCLAVGQDTRGAHHLNQVAVGICAVLPPYPHPPKAYEDIIGVPLYIKDANFYPAEMPLCSFHPAELMDGEGEADFASAGHYLGTATGTGSSVREAARQALKNLKSLSMPAGMFYRNDIGQRLKKELPKLHQHGFAQDMEF